MSAIYQIKEPRGAVLTRDVGLGGVLIGQECRYGICGGKGWGATHGLTTYVVCQVTIIYWWFSYYGAGHH